MTNQIVPRKNENEKQADSEVKKAVENYQALTTTQRRDFQNQVLNPKSTPVENDISDPVKTSWTVSELLAATFPEPKWAVPGLIPDGLTFLSGRPKVGKSWLALQLAHACGTGGYFLGVKVEQHKVLFIAYEDSPRRLQSRIRAHNIPASAQIRFETTWPKLSADGLTLIYSEITMHGYDLIIIDTLTRALGGDDQMDLALMSSVIGNLQGMAINHGISVVCNDHLRKPNGFESNPIDDIMGSTGKAAAIDCALGLYREQGRHGATLKIIGREVEERELALRWDGLTRCWQNEGEAGDVRKDSFKGEVIEAIQGIIDDGKLATTASIAKWLGKEASNVSMALAELWSAGKVKKGEKIGREVPYVLP